MSEHQIVQMIALAACLVLVGAGLAGRRLDWSKGIRLAMVWVGLFVIVTLFISIVAGG